MESASSDALEWMARMWNDPVFKQLSRRYHEQARDPETCIPHYDDIFRGRDDIQYSTFAEDWTFTVPGK